MIHELSGYGLVTPNPRFECSIFDLRLENRALCCFVEVKGCSLLAAKVGLFPDAPTRRGRRHLRDLAGARRAGYRSVVFFVVQNPEAEALAPNDGTDPLFGDSLRRAMAEGVEALAFRVMVKNGEAKLTFRIGFVTRVSPR